MTLLCCSNMISFEQSIFSKNVLSPLGIRLISIWELLQIVSQQGGSFNQDVSGWAISSGIKTDGMFEKAELLQQTLREHCGVSSFFENNMSREQRRLHFAGGFKWSRRKYFTLFLVCQGYLNGSADLSSHKGHKLTPCDLLFDIEDLDREICKYL